MSVPTASLVLMRPAEGRFPGVGGRCRPLPGAESRFPGAGGRCRPLPEVAGRCQGLPVGTWGLPAVAARAAAGAAARVSGVENWAFRVGKIETARARVHISMKTKHFFFLFTKKWFERKKEFIYSPSLGDRRNINANGGRHVIYWEVYLVAIDGVAASVNTFRHVGSKSLSNGYVWK